MDPQKEGQEGSKHPSEELVDWLKEAGRRRHERSAGESSAELITHLEQLTGTTIRTREDVEALVGRLGPRKSQRSRDTRRSLLLGVLLLIAILQYYFIEVQLEILTQPSLTVFVPAKAVPSVKPQRT